MPLSEQTLQSRREKYGDRPTADLYCGITIRPGTQLTFTQLLEKPSYGDNCINLPPKYALNSNIPRSCCNYRFLPFPPQLSNYFTEESWEKEVEVPIRRAIDDANKKRLELSSVLITNPKVPSSIKLTNNVIRCLSSLPTIVSAVIMYIFCLTLPVILLIMYIIYIPQMLCTTRDNEMEKQWMQSKLRDIPHLEPAEIESQIGLNLKEIAENLSKKNPTLQVEYWNGIRRMPRAGSDASYDLDEFSLFFHIGKIQSRKTVSSGGDPSPTYGRTVYPDA